ncbi:dTDP-6-deoxy-3,4-keto-hexulose isomerase [Pseudomonas synxantha]|nr:dTDP-6-deoxy-3,4-keto-hexulose isomerase [Pseudomonas synxantha]
MDNGQEQREFMLDSPDKAILISKMVWHEMHDFSENCVLLVLADDYYDESDYIRDYDAFKLLL